jgi:hypothetical protein
MAPRKYKEPKHYRYGGRVLADATIPDDAPPQSEAPPVMQGDDALVRAAEATRRADELQRAPPQQSLDEFVESLPISDHKKDFLKQWPQMLEETRAKIMHRHHQAALAEGIPDDTPDMDRFLLDAVNREMSGSNAARRAMPHEVVGYSVEKNYPETVEQAAEKLDREVSGLLLQQEAQRSIPTNAVLGIPEAPKPKPRIPFSAPVSRDLPTATGESMSSSTKVTLTAEERQIARNSYTAPDMTNEQKELAYARMKLRLARERANGAYPMPERN